MRVRFALGALVGLAFLSASTPLHAGAWTLDKSTGLALFTLTPSTATEVFDGDRRLRSTPRYNKFEFQALFEYGVTDWFTLILAPGLQHISIAAPVDARRTGLGYSEFGGRARLTGGANWVLSAQGTTRIPGTFDTGNPAAIGNNGFEQDIRLLFGHGFSVGAWPAFIDLQLGQRFKAGNRPSEVHIDGTFGIRPAEQWLLMAQVFNVISEGDNPPLFPSYDYSKLQLSLVRQLTQQWALQLGGFTTFHGRNALQENGVLAGAWYKY